MNILRYEPPNTTVAACVASRLFLSFLKKMENRMYDLITWKKPFFFNKIAMGRFESEGRLNSYIMLWHNALHKHHNNTKTNLFFSKKDTR